MLTPMPHRARALPLLLLLISGAAAWSEDATHAAPTPASAAMPEFDQGVLCGCYVQAAMHASVNALTLVQHPEIGDDVRTTMWHQIDSDLLTIGNGWDLIQPAFARLNANYRTAFVGSIDNINTSRVKCGIANARPEYERRIQALFILVRRFGAASATAAAAGP
jgi:hypothetical protein